MDLDWTMVGVLVTAISGAGGFAVKHIKDTMDKTVTNAISKEELSRKATADAILANQASMKEDIHDLKEDLGPRVSSLEHENRDFRSGAKIDADIAHTKGNILQIIEGVKTTVSQHTTNIELMRDRVTVLETEGRLRDRAVDRIENELRDTRQEINARLDTMAAQALANADAAKHQFDQLCESIREIRKPPEPK